MWLAAVISLAFTTSQPTHLYTASCWVSDLAPHINKKRPYIYALPWLPTTNTADILLAYVPSHHRLLPLTAGGDPTLRTWIGASSSGPTKATAVVADLVLFYYSAYPSLFIFQAAMTWTATAFCLQNSARSAGQTTRPLTLCTGEYLCVGSRV